ncbi:hypothetical protein WN943_010651 [Citrus x changshan-huyou]
MKRNQTSLMQLWQGRRHRGTLQGYLMNNINILRRYQQSHFLFRLILFLASTSNRNNREFYLLLLLMQKKWFCCF